MLLFVQPWALINATTYNMEDLMQCIHELFYMSQTMQLPRSIKLLSKLDSCTVLVLIVTVVCRAL